MVWNRNDYLREVETQLRDTNVYEEISEDVISPLDKITKYHLPKFKFRGDISSQTLVYFLVNNPHS